MLCRNLNLFAESLVVIDGSKFKAVNAREKNFTRAKMRKRLAQIEESIDKYFSQLDNADSHDTSESDSASQLQDKITQLKAEMSRLKKLETRMEKHPDKQVSLTDPDARSMVTGGKGMVGYNTQAAVDCEHHLIVAHEVTNIGNDRGQLLSMAKKARLSMGTENLKVLADRGYFKGEEILACDEAGITTYVPEPLTSRSKKQGRFSKQDFQYLAETNEYLCPAKQRLPWHYIVKEGGRDMHCYWNRAACRDCSIKAHVRPPKNAESNAGNMKRPLMLCNRD